MRRDVLFLREMISAGPEVPWRRPTQLRNRVVHAYWAVDVEILHTTARDLLPSFVADVRAILDQIERETAPLQS